MNVCAVCEIWVKARPRTLGCVAMDSAVLLISWSRFSLSLFGEAKTALGMVVCISLLHSCVYM